MFNVYGIEVENCYVMCSSQPKAEIEFEKYHARYGHREDYVFHATPRRVVCKGNEVKFVYQITPGMDNDTPVIDLTSKVPATFKTVRRVR